MPAVAIQPNTASYLPTLCCCFTNALTVGSTELQVTRYHWWCSQCHVKSGELSWCRPMCFSQVTTSQRFCTFIFSFRIEIQESSCAQLSLRMRLVTVRRHLCGLLVAKSMVISPHNFKIWFLHEKIIFFIGIFFSDQICSWIVRFRWVFVYILPSEHF